MPADLGNAEEFGEVDGAQGPEESQDAGGLNQVQYPEVRWPQSVEGALWQGKQEERDEKDEAEDDIGQAVEGHCGAQCLRGAGFDERGSQQAVKQSVDQKVEAGTYPGWNHGLFSDVPSGESRL